MLIDAIVLAGGRSSRLSGEPKSSFLVEGRSLLSRTVAAASAARFVAVVGEVDALPLDERLADRVVVTREDPAFSGPASGIAAGIALLSAFSNASLENEHSQFTLVLACDMPDVEGAVVALLDALWTAQGASGVIAIDDTGHRQLLAAVYDTAALGAAIAAHHDAGDLENLSVRALVGHLALIDVPVPSGSTADIDTWADAARYGITPVPPTATTPAHLPTPHHPIDETETA